jgi:hypothetical protein
MKIEIQKFGSDIFFADCFKLTNKCFCEHPRDSLLRQPSNSISNLVFTIVGIISLLETAIYSVRRRQVVAARTESIAREELFETYVSSVIVIVTMFLFLLCLI